jgi:large subunit ribosomal protein L21
MYAIIDEGGRQHRVTAGDTIRIDREVPEGETNVTFDRILLVGGAGDGRIGTPVVAGATVTAEVLGEARGPKIDIFKYKRRKGYRKRQGHRQTYTAVKITAINV